MSGPLQWHSASAGVDERRKVLGSSHSVGLQWNAGSAGVDERSRTLRSSHSVGLQWNAGSAGVDEAGRGALAGPIFAGAVMLRQDRAIPGLKDSKQLSAKRREELAERIRSEALAFALGRAEVEEIDALNVLQASLLAMARAIAGLAVQPDRVYVDGGQAPQIDMDIPVVAVIKGDALLPPVSAGAILAKTVRDAEMRRLAAVHPGYGFDRHKGYGTKQHLAGLAALGPSPIHRRSFAPVRSLLSQSPAAAGAAGPVR